MGVFSENWRVSRTLLWLLLISALTGASWSVLQTRIGPTLRQTSAFTSAAEGSAFLRELQPRYLDTHAIEGRSPLIPFEALLWGDPLALERRIHTMRARLIVPGLTHVDAVIDQTDEDRLLFRLSRHAAIPSGFIQQHDGVGTAATGSASWPVEETILTPPRRAELMEVNYQWPHQTLRLMSGAFRSAYFNVEVRRTGDQVAAWVNGEPAGQFHVTALPQGAWGFEAGDLPYTFLERLELEGEALVRGEWKPFRRTVALDSGLTRGEAFAHGALWSAIAFAVLVTVASLGWLLAPGLGFARWLRKVVPLGLMALALAATVLLLRWFGDPDDLHVVFQLTLWLTGITYALMLGAAGRHWRWRATSTSAPGPLNALRENWLAMGLLARVLWVFAAAAMVYVLLNRTQLVSLGEPAPQISEQVLLRDAEIGRGEFRFTQPKGFPSRDLRSGELRVWLRATAEPTTIELLARLHDFPLPSYPEWAALRVSTDADQSGLLTSDSRGVEVPMGLALPTSGEVSLTLTSRGDTVRALLNGREVGRLRTRVDSFGQFALVVREGSAHVTLAKARGTVSLPFEDERSPMRRWPTALWVSAAFVVAVLGAIAVSLPLAGWLALRVRGLAAGLLVVALAAGGAFVWRGTVLRGLPLTTAWEHARFALPLAVLAAVGGVYVLLLAHRDRARRRTLPMIALLIAMLVLVEIALRSTTYGWQLNADTPRGEIHRRFLLRWMQEPMVLMTLTGRLAARGEVARPREEGDELVRIITLGGSSTYGSGVIHDGQAWPHQLEMQLVSSEVFNFGRPSLTAFDNRLFLERDLLVLDPDWVILSAGGNDAIRPIGNPPPQRRQWTAMHSATPRQEQIRSLLTRTRVLTILNWLVRGGLTPRDQQRRIPQHPPEEFRATLHEICDLADEHGFRVAFVAEPMWESVVFENPDVRRWHEVMHEVAIERDQLYIDPSPAFRELINDHLWATWIHPNDYGNEVMADTLADALAEPITGQPPSPEWQQNP